MKTSTICSCALGILAVAGCDRLERVVDLGHRAQEETRRERDRQSQADDRQTALRAERDSLDALIGGKLSVLSNRLSEAEAAMRTLQADRAALSRELGAAMDGNREACGAGLERALASPGVNGLAMKYLRMDFAVARGEYAEALAKARASEADFKRSLKKLNQTFAEAVDSDIQAKSATRRSRTAADLVREHDQLQRKRRRLARETVPTGNVYNNRRLEHERELRNLDIRLQTLERMIDKMRTEDETARNDVDRATRRAREVALNERNLAIDRLKKEYGDKADVLKIVQAYNEKTLRRLEQALVREAADMEEKRRKSREDWLFLQGIRASVPRLSAGGLKRLQSQVSAL